MSAPLPVTVHTEPSKLALPAAATAPMSTCDQPLGMVLPDSSSTVNGSVTPSLLRPVLSVTVTLMRLWVLGGAGCCQMHDRAAGPRPVHSAIAVQLAPLSADENTSKRASGLPRSSGFQRMVYGATGTTSFSAGRSTKTSGGSVDSTVYTTESVAWLPCPSSTVTMMVLAPGCRS